MKKILVLLITVLILLAGTIVVLATQISSQDATGSVTAREYSYTKAICTDKNFCQDYVIACNGNQLISQIPIDGATLQNSLDWKDPRNQESIELLCG